MFLSISSAIYNLMLTRSNQKKMRKMAMFNSRIKVIRKENDKI